ncbi:DUF5675 family protein [Adhaeribacter radiodurans]|uniref:DUF5675 domain-containing protein n=1 Tax=Adhaeribacter radiodurans TaxID=2745197 RepID=A0A7L7LAR8_9BACT|nr:DUF5675 family protein [Adhaeribacter radiodurans]QMU29804.1 hypothetical protein HUW48_18030 [Adhaeribacter radiodurans]
MQIKVVRSVYSPTSTLGKMFINSEFFAYTLEDTDRNLKGDCQKKQKSQTAIVSGTYPVVLSFSNNFQKYLPLLLNVPCFEGIRIHGGNTCKDSLGCILIGEQSNMQDKIWNCASKVNSLVALLKAVEKKEKIWIEIEKEAAIA